MVNIVASSVYDETITHTFNANNNASSEFDAVNFPAVPISGVSGFAYIEDVIVDVTFTNQVTVEDLDGTFDSDFDLFVSVGVLFNNNIDLFQTVNNLLLTVFNNTGTINIPTSMDQSTVSDTYIDSPADIAPNMFAETNCQIVNTVTTDIRTQVTFIGRSP